MTTCPKCSYTRTTTDAAPESECPSCGVIYAKFDAAADARRRELIAAAAGIQVAARDAAERDAWNDTASSTRRGAIASRRGVAPLTAIVGGVLVVLVLASLSLPKPQQGMERTEAHTATEAATLSRSPTYTPEQLHAMIARGQYPAQGPVSSTSHDMSFAACAAQLRQVLGAVAADYPAQVVASVPGYVQSEKVWAADGTVLITCSSPDAKMVVTRSAYR